jgi:cysteinyl-tRNA synthetase
VWEAVAEPTTAGVPAEAETLLAERDAARSARDYATADRLRDELAELGWDVVDGPDGSTLRPRS